MNAKKAKYIPIVNQELHALNEGMSKRQRWNRIGAGRAHSVRQIIDD